MKAISPFLLLLLVLAVQSAEPPGTPKRAKELTPPSPLDDPFRVIVTGRVTTPKAVSPLLFSAFIELAFGRSDLISAELLLDRGFELPEGASLNDANGWCARSKPKLELEDWWHSGYEEHRWRLVKSETNQAATMSRVGGTALLAPNGKFYLRLENGSTNQSACLAQDGVWINLKNAPKLAIGAQKSPKNQGVVWILESSHKCP
jgi:hypothetical protein